MQINDFNDLLYAYITIVYTLYKFIDVDIDVELLRCTIIHGGSCGTVLNKEKKGKELFNTQYMMLERASSWRSRDIMATYQIPPAREV